MKADFDTPDAAEFYLCSHVSSRRLRGHLDPHFIPLTLLTCSFGMYLSRLDRTCYEHRAGRLSENTIDI